MALTLTDTQTALEPFLQRNQSSELAEDGDGGIFVQKPWGDRTLALLVPDEEQERNTLFETLNSCFLPEKYSAIHHVEENLLEVTWTAYKLNSASADTADRAFDFVYKGKTHACRFGAATEKLLAISSCAAPVSNSTATNYRNLMSFILYDRKESGDHDNPAIRSLSEPRSFFIELQDLEWENVDDLVVHLNAYMSYYDTKSPQILIHEQISTELPTRDRYLHGSFPGHILAREIDKNALTYWREATLSSNEIMSFLTCYRIVEYLAFHFIEVQTKSKIRRVLSSPHALTDLDRTMRSVVESLSTKNATEDIPKAQNLVCETLDLQLVWKEIEKHKEFFCQSTDFDGGYTVKSLIKDKDSFETFSNNGVRSMLDRLRGIRNALSHGQDQQTRSVIRPTAHNNQIIRPWLNLIEIIAGEAMLNSEVV